MHFSLDCLGGLWGIIKPMLAKQLEQLVQGLAPEAKTFLLAVSGGADSVALFRLCLELGLDFEVAHLDHSLRASSEAEADFVRDLCQRFGKPFHTEKVFVADIAHKNSWNVEETARKLRYSFLTRVAKKQALAAIMTAHTLDDQAETVLMQLLRGAAHLVGIKAVNRQLIRPLLSVPKSVLLSYLADIQQDFRLDESNLDTSYTRAWLRHEIMPLLELRYPRLHDTLARLALLQSDQWAYLQKEALKLKAAEGFSVARVAKADKVLQRQVMASLLQEADLALSFERIEEMLGLLGKQTPKRLSLSKDKQFRLAYGTMQVTNRQITKLDEEYLQSAEQLPETIPREVFARYPRLMYRSRRPGDVMHLSGGSKKLSEILIDKKIPREDRDKLKLLASGKQVLWVENLLLDPALAKTEENADLAFMRLALEQAKLAAGQGELPVGAVIVCAGSVIARAYNQTETRKDPSAHAELLAMREAARVLGDWRLSACTLYVTLEPCAMCFGAMLQAHVPRLVYAAANHREGALGSVVDLNQFAWKREIAVLDGVLAKPCKELLSQFFADKR